MEFEVLSEAFKKQLADDAENMGCSPEVLFEFIETANDEQTVALNRRWLQRFRFIAES